MLAELRAPSISSISESKAVMDYNYQPARAASHESWSQVEADSMGFGYYGEYDLAASAASSYTLYVNPKQYDRIGKRRDTRSRQKSERDRLTRKQKVSGYP